MLLKLPLLFIHLFSGHNSATEASEENTAKMSARFAILTSFISALVILISQKANQEFKPPSFYVSLIDEVESITAKKETIKEIYKKDMDIYPISVEQLSLETAEILDSPEGKIKNNFEELLHHSIDKKRQDLWPLLFKWILVHQNQDASSQPLSHSQVKTEAELSVVDIEAETAYSELDPEDDNQAQENLENNKKSVVLGNQINIVHDVKPFIKSILHEGSSKVAIFNLAHLIKFLNLQCDIYRINPIYKFNSEELTLIEDAVKEMSRLKINNICFQNWVIYQSTFDKIQQCLNGVDFVAGLSVAMLESTLEKENSMNDFVAGVQMLLAGMDTINLFLDQVKSKVTLAPIHDQLRQRFSESDEQH